MKTKWILLFFLSVMAVMIFFALVFPAELREVLNRPSMYQHVLFTHIVAVTLFFANAVVGILWELRSLASGRKEVILHTYNTVAWLDARFSSPMLIISIIAAIMLSLMLGDIWQIGWLSLAFFLFLFSGLVWVISDIPTQYKIKTLIKNADPDAQVLPQELLRILKMRIWISIAGVFPLIVVFFLMIYKYKKPIDFYLSFLAGIAALSLLMFPTSNIVEKCIELCDNYTIAFIEYNEFRINFHYISATVFLVILNYMCFFLFTRKNEQEIVVTEQKKKRNIVYYICGSLMSLALLVMFLKLINKFPEDFYINNNLTFWMETLALEAFGFSWLVKGEFILKDK